MPSSLSACMEHTHSAHPMTYTNHNGITQTMGAEEFEAVERSGRSS
jgi:hypothetical protein